MIIFTLVIVSVGVSFFTSILLIRLRDLAHLFDLGFMLGFYATPIFYPLSFLPMRAQQIMKLNPLFYIIDGARKALIENKIEYLEQNLIILGVGISLFIFGIFFFRRNVKKVAEHF